jgi:putative ABC transport system permease protein
MVGNTKEYFKMAVRNLKMRSLRSWLTIFGIIMGVFLIMSLLSLSEGIRITVQKQLMSLGGNMIIVMPGDDSNPLASMMYGGDKLEKSDLTMIGKAAGVDQVVPFDYRGVNVRFKEYNKSLVIEGLPIEEGLDALKLMQGWSLSGGEWPQVGKREIVVGSRFAEDVFDEKVKIGDEFNVKGKRLIVTGILNSLGAKDDDAAIFMDIELFYDITGEKRGTARMAMVTVREGSDPNAVAEEIKTNLKKSQKKQFGREDLNYAVITAEKIQGIAGDVLGVIELAVLAFASIAIVVGGIGITNTMYTAVRERTREIGIMKAVGAPNSAILSIFLFEAGIIGFIGGFAGTGLGLLAAWSVELYGQVHPMFYFRASFSPWIILFGLSFSFIIGCIAGILPARRAAKLRPIEALRKYE